MEENTEHEVEPEAAKEAAKEKRAEEQDEEVPMRDEGLDRSASGAHRTLGDT
jgi:hypothetical protein